jgi:hypothetical protein
LYFCTRDGAKKKHEEGISEHGYASTIPTLLFTI